MGMTIALDEFLVEHRDEWVLQYKTEENNGITIIARIGVLVPWIEFYLTRERPGVDLDFVGPNERQFSNVLFF